MKNNNYKEEFSNYISIMNEALKKDDFAAYEMAKDMLDEAINERKEKMALVNEMNTSNFGILNHIFENELPNLLKTNKKAVKNVIKTIKEDKNLSAEFKFYHLIKEQYNGEAADKISADKVLDELEKIISEDISIPNVKASNKKLKNVMIENNIYPSSFIDDESKKLYECGNVILTKKKSAENMISLIESRDAICEYMENHKNDKKVKGIDIDNVIKEYEEKLKTNLNESEISFVKQITDFRTPMADKRKEKLFNKFKNECIDKISELLKEDENNDGLVELKAQLEEQMFNKDTIVKDIAKLLEIRDILMDN